ncbi:hypothetical protein [Parasitella parasitica]|uniref:Uncharacterized protein n=1 Tax=Parasitella parasitica TaxID=35722 RepID=A0A0B7NCK2_9FUNG|nr:hypothetical protein [Parasitella parasitica]
MPASTTLFKSKWNSFVSKLTPAPSNNQQPQQQPQLRRGSDDTIISRFKSRKHSDAMSVGTFDSNVSIRDKFRHVIPFFRRRNSSNTSASIEDVAHTPITSVDYCQQLDKLQALYILAIDELNYAEDSQGSSYYSGDRVTAREAIDDCANAYYELLRHTSDAVARESLRSSMAPKLLKIQKRMNTLPKVDEDDDYY